MNFVKDGVEPPKRFSFGEKQSDLQYGRLSLWLASSFLFLRLLGAANTEKFQSHFATRKLPVKCRVERRGRGEERVGWDVEAECGQLFPEHRM